MIYWVEYCPLYCPFYLYLVFKERSQNKVFFWLELITISMIILIFGLKGAERIILGLVHLSISNTLQLFFLLQYSFGAAGLSPLVLEEVARIGVFS